MIQGLKGDVALEILTQWNESHDTPITRYLVEKSAGHQAKQKEAKLTCPLLSADAKKNAISPRKPTISEENKG